MRRRFSQISQLEAGQEHPQRLRVLCAIKPKTGDRNQRKSIAYVRIHLKYFHLLFGSWSSKFLPNNTYGV